MCPTLTLRQTRETVWNEEGKRVWDNLDAENNGTPEERIAVIIARFKHAQKGRNNG